MIYLFSFLFGAVLGSFANVCILRLPDEKSLRFPGSHCPGCGTPVRPSDNIPILSFFLLRGRCRGCGTRISWQYPIVEALMGALFAAWAVVFWPDCPKTILLDVLTFYLLTISIIDYRHRIIPDELSISLFVLGIALAWINPALEGSFWTRVLASAGAGLAGGVGMYALASFGEWVFKQEALGGGDIKLVAAFGAVLGWKGVTGSLLFGSVAGGLMAGVLILAGKKGRRDTLPFGPFLCFGALLVAILPSRILNLIFP